MTRLVWYRNDLRVSFHRPLQAAMATDEPVRALYLLCPDQWRQHDVAPIRQWYVLASLLELGDSLAELGVELDVIDCGDFASVPDVLKRYVTQRGITDIHCCREYPLNELRRDRAAVAALESDGVRFHGVDDAVLVPPKALKTGQGGWYTVFSPYRRSWEKWLSEHGAHSDQAVRQRQPLSFPGRSVVEAALNALNVPESLRQYWQPGEKAAREQLSRFIANGLCSYDDRRDLPAEPCTSSWSAA
mgnify:CR=1 FL=1